MIEIKISIWDILEDIRQAGHNGFINAKEYNSSEGARHAMEKRIVYYKSLIENNKLKITRSKGDTQ